MILISAFKASIFYWVVSLDNQRKEFLLILSFLLVRSFPILRNWQFNSGPPVSCWRMLIPKSEQFLMVFLLLCQQSSVWNISQHCKHPGFPPLVPASAYGGSLFTYAERPAKLMQVLLTCEDMLSLALKKGWNAPLCQRDRAVPVTQATCQCMKMQISLCCRSKTVWHTAYQVFLSQWISFSFHLTPYIVG